MHLLDVNVLIALCDGDHPLRPATKAWFMEHAGRGWATCPLTENAVLRILGNSGYPGGPGSPAAVRPLLAALCALPGHVFWADDISMAAEPDLISLAGASSKELTDIYLLALAVRHGGWLCTLDHGIRADSVAGGPEAIRVVS
jgi:hypothetical protein